MDYYKVYCEEHPYDPVTNFCTQPGCLVGLCATCVCQHTQNHIARGTVPRYENVKDTYTRYNQRMREQVELIEQDKDWLGVIVQKIEDKRNNVIETIGKARSDCLALVNRHFDQLEQKISAEIVSQGKRNSLHSLYRLETLNTLMLKEISNLLLYSKDLASGKFLETAKIVEEEVFPNSKDFHLKICKELKENEVYTASAVYREEFLGDVIFGLKKLINLEFLLPRVEYVEGPPKIERADDIRRANSLKRNNSASAVFSNMRQSNIISTPTKSQVRNISALLPKHCTSIIMPSVPLQQLFGNRTQVSSPMLTKNSRLGAGLKIIRESKRQSVTGDDNRSLTASSVSGYAKENDGLAYSTYFDSGSNFFR